MFGEDKGDYRAFRLKKQFRNRYVKRVRELGKVIEGYVPQRPLDSTDVGAM